MYTVDEFTIDYPNLTLTYFHESWEESKEFKIDIDDVGDFIQENQPDLYRAYREWVDGEEKEELMFSLKEMMTYESTPLLTEIFEDLLEQRLSDDEKKEELVMDAHDMAVEFAKTSKPE